MRTERFEVRSAHTGRLADAHGRVIHAIADALVLEKETGRPFFIVDLFLPTSPHDDRIVWRNAPVAPQALLFLRANCTYGL